MTPKVLSVLNKLAKEKGYKDWKEYRDTIYSIHSPYPETVERAVEIALEKRKKK